MKDNRKENAAGNLGQELQMLKKLFVSGEKDNRQTIGDGPLLTIFCCDV